MNRAAKRAQQREQAAMERRGARRARRYPRCPLCNNEITERDVTKVEAESGVETKVHRTCAERLEHAKKIQAAQRVSEAGIWLPGDDLD